MESTITTACCKNKVKQHENRKRTRTHENESDVCDRIERCSVGTFSAPDHTDTRVLARSAFEVNKPRGVIEEVRKEVLLLSSFSFRTTVFKNTGLRNSASLTDSTITSLGFRCAYTTISSDFDFVGCCISSSSTVSKAQKNE